MAENGAFELYSCGISTKECHRYFIKETVSSLKKKKKKKKERKENVAYVYFNVSKDDWAKFGLALKYKILVHSPGNGRELVLIYPQINCHITQN